MAHSSKSEAKKAAPSLRDRAIAACLALLPAEVKRQPSHIKARLSWLRALLPLIAKDRVALLEAPLDPVLTAAELDMLPSLVELIGECDAGTVAATTAPRLTPAETQWLASLRGEQMKLDRAFRVRLKFDRAALKALALIRRGLKRDIADMLDDARRLTSLADDPRHAVWVKALKKGEPEAVVALRAAIPTLEAISIRLKSIGPANASRDQLRRLFTIALRIGERVVTAGIYHTADLPGRGRNYKRFQRPVVRKPRKKHVEE